MQQSLKPQRCCIMQFRGELWCKKLFLEPFQPTGYLPTSTGIIQNGYILLYISPKKYRRAFGEQNA